MAVDIKTLHIGSLVEYDGKRMVVASVSNKLMNCENLILIEPSTLTLYKNVNSYDVEPISITPELLKELGFEHKREGCWQHWWKDGFDLQHRDESEYWHIHGDIGIEYLHELESLYYMIYGVELIEE